MLYSSLEGGQSEELPIFDLSLSESDIISYSPWNVRIGRSELPTRGLALP